MLAVECVQSPVVAAEEKKPEGKEMQKIAMDTKNQLSSPWNGR